MRVYIDAELLVKQKFGAGIIAYELIRNIVSSFRGEAYLLRSRKFTKYHLLDGFISNYIWKQLILPIMGFLARIDVALFPNPPISFLGPFPKIVIIYDVSFYFDKSLNPLIRFFEYVTYLISCRKAVKIITISCNSKKDIVKLFHIDAAKVVVAYPSVNKDIFKPISKQFALSKLKEKCHIDGKFILAVLGSLITRKNVVKLLYAYNALPSEIKLQYILVIVAKKSGSLFDKIRFYRITKIIKDLGLEKNVIITGYVPHEEMPLFYNGAEVLVYPSLYEGFGLPVLEAMACGTPVIGSNTSSIPEVTGDAAMLIDPNNIEELTNALREILTNKRLRDELRKKGLERTKLFSWDKFIGLVIDVLKESMKSRAFTVTEFKKRNE